MHTRDAVLKELQREEYLYKASFEVFADRLPMPPKAVQCISKQGSVCYLYHEVIKSQFRRPDATRFRYSEAGILLRIKAW